MKLNILINTCITLICTFIIKLTSAGICDSLPETSPFTHRLKLIRVDCGDVCDTSSRATSPGKYYDFIRKDIECLNLYESPLFEEFADNIQPPKWCDLPKVVQKMYTYDDQIEEFFSTHMVDTAWTKDKVDPWTKEMVEGAVQNSKQGALQGAYGTNVTLDIKRHLKDHVLAELKGNVLVIGSQSPWIEATLIDLGATKITTLEYSELESHHPFIKTVTPKDLNQMFMEGYFSKEENQFDLVVTFSSVEHSGLGRYGDALNPWGDLIAMAKAWCITKAGGKALVGVPTGKDVMTFNAGRIYGPLMFSHLFANWNVIYTEAIMGDEEVDKCGTIWCYQPVHILEKA